MSTFKKIGIIGAGNVAFHLGELLLEERFQLTSIYSRTKEKADRLAERWHIESLSNWKDFKCDLILLCIHDDEIDSFLKQYDLSIPIAFTAGNVPMSDYPIRKYGVFYPLQTFTANRTVTKNFPILIEGNSKEMEYDLMDLAKKLSLKVDYATSVQRSQYHLAAVVMNNFINHLIYLSKQNLTEKGLHPQFLDALLQETFEKIKTISPFDAQTGPAKRGDHSTIQKHLTMLDSPLKEIYQAITQSILNTYHEKL